MLKKIKLWATHIWFAQHNARVIEDFEERMTSVIYAATGGMMSKPYYTKQAMLHEIADHHDRLEKQAYEDGQEDARTS